MPRKVSYCSKTEGGADAFSAFTSVLSTLARKGGGSRWWMVCAVCSAARLSTPAPPELLPHTPTPLIDYDKLYWRSWNRERSHGSRYWTSSGMGARVGDDARGHISELVERGTANDGTAAVQFQPTT